ncbi:MAG: hypothetical protein IRY87_28735 [Acetobacteraceae bacterium]|nr:hypothetical protein [Acetobacteraceae bacterium]
MRRNGGWMGPSVALGLAVMLGGCQAVQSAISTPADSDYDAGGLFGSAWGGSRPEMLTDSLTIARLRGAAPATEPLQPESGNVWPAEEAPRATLANPDAALRGVPAYTPNIPPEPGQVPLGSISRGAPARLRGSANPPPPPLVQPEQQRSMVAPPLPPLPEPPPRRNEGQVVQTPQGPVVTGSGTDRVQTFIAPGGGTGIIQRDNGTATIIGPDGRVQTVPAQR